MASRIAAALSVATSSVQGTLADVAGVSQNPAAMLGATAANAQATLAVALVLDDMRRRWIRGMPATPGHDAVVELARAADDAAVALGPDHITSKRIRRALQKLAAVQSIAAL